jgi:hypothetical protein
MTRFWGLSLPICIASAVALMMIADGIDTTSDALPTRSTSIETAPTETPWIALETAVAVVVTYAPTSTPTARPERTREPTNTPIPYCWETDDVKCDQWSPTATATEHPTLAPPATIGPCGTPDAFGNLPRYCEDES